MSDFETQTRFRREVMPHFDAAYNLARWLTGTEADAEDVIQESMLRAFRALPGLNLDKPRAWLLQIVRNTAYTWLRKKGQLQEWRDDHDRGADPADDPGVALENHQDHRLLREAIAALPPEFREILVLRELDELSYREIADIAQIPEGTVMSRLSRARRMLKERLLALNVRRP